MTTRRIQKGMAWLLWALLAPALPALAQEEVRYYHTDALGSVVAISDENGAIVERREYEPYGRQLVPATLADGPGYTGHVLDAATGMVYMQQRYYDPAIGRFLSRDPVSALKGPFNRYWYANANPYRFTDPDGRQSCSDVCLKMRAASDRVGGGVEGMTRWGMERVFGFVNKEADKHTFSNTTGAVTYFGSWAVPLQKKYGVEVGANLAEVSGKYKVSDFHPGSNSGSVETWGYGGPGRWAGILHTHPGTQDLSGAGVDARAITGYWDTGQAALRGVDAYVVKSDYTIQRLNYQAWMKFRDSHPGEPAYAGWFYEGL